MEFEMLASIQLQLVGPSLDVTRISTHLGFEPDDWKRKGEKRPSGDHGVYHEHRCRYRLEDKRLIRIGERLKIHMPALAGLEDEIHKNVSEGGAVWLIVSLYDTEFVGLALDHEQLAFLSRLKIGFSFENRSPD
ncbi:MAG: hypothetical protein HWE25_02650 [Alphaproteobacteria bacterium]|nr:hypothetical protein [Alphaproteobacteria bacterium]